jgi:hypothetical protein
VSFCQLWPQGSKEQNNSAQEGAGGGETDTNACRDPAHGVNINDGEMAVCSFAGCSKREAAPGTIFCNDHLSECYRVLLKDYSGMGRGVASANCPSGLPKGFLMYRMPIESGKRLTREQVQEIERHHEKGFVSTVFHLNDGTGVDFGEVPAWFFYLNTANEGEPCNCVAKEDIHDETGEPEIRFVLIREVAQGEQLLLRYFRDQNEGPERHAPEVVGDEAGDEAEVVAGDEAEVVAGDEAEVVAGDEAPVVAGVEAEAPFVVGVEAGVETPVVAGVEAAVAGNKRNAPDGEREIGGSGGAGAGGGQIANKRRRKKKNQKEQNRKALRSRVHGVLCLIAEFAAPNALTGDNVPEVDRQSNAIYHILCAMKNKAVDQDAVEAFFADSTVSYKIAVKTLQGIATVSAFKVFLLQVATVMIKAPKRNTTGRKQQVEPLLREIVPQMAGQCYEKFTAAESFLLEHPEILLMRCDFPAVGG